MVSVAVGGGQGPTGDADAGGMVTTTSQAQATTGGASQMALDEDSEDETLADVLGAPAVPTVWSGAVKTEYWGIATKALETLSDAAKAEQASLDNTNRKLTPACRAVIAEAMLARFGESHKGFLSDKRLKDAWERECSAHDVPKPASTRKVLTAEEGAAKVAAKEKLAATKARSAATLQQAAEDTARTELALAQQCEPLMRAVQASARACARFVSEETLAASEGEMQVLKVGPARHSHSFTTHATSRGAVLLKRARQMLPATS